MLCDSEGICKKATDKGIWCSPFSNKNSFNAEQGISSMIVYKFTINYKCRWR